MDKSKFNDKKEWRNFALGVMGILCFIATLLLIRKHDNFYYFYIIGGAFGLLGLIAPIVIKPVFILFSYIGFGMGFVMSKVILTIFYFIILSPIAIFSRLFGKKFLQLKVSDDIDSYWVVKNEEDNKTQKFENQF